MCSSLYKSLIYQQKELFGYFLYFQHLYKRWRHFNNSNFQGNTRYSFLYQRYNKIKSLFDRFLDNHFRKKAIFKYSKPYGVYFRTEILLFEQKKTIKKKYEKL